MKIVLNKLIPFKDFVAMNLFGSLFVNKEKNDKVNVDQVLFISDEMI